jgi:rhodanese-related sulfurtransferase/uncharacterized membrane protein YphA (DoxX/SURF4 family)
MKILNYFTAKTTVTACFIGTIAMLVIAMVAGLAENKISRHPLAFTQNRKTGVEKIDLARARMLHDQKALFVDARSPDRFKDGHIPGARDFDYFNFDAYFNEFAKKFDRTTPFVVYCEGISGEKNEDTCETSGLLSRQLFERGYKNVTVFEQGFAFWENAGFPVDRGEGTAGKGGSGEAGKRGKFPLVNYFRDLVMLLIGCLALVLVKKRPFLVAVQILLGVIFIISASSKLFSPEKLAIILEAYRILPSSLVPIAAIWMPWVELITGAALVTGTLPASGALVIVGMNLFFIPALSYRALFLSHQLGLSLFGVDFDCGCGLGENFAWVLILRDLGFLMMGAAVMAMGVGKKAGQ